MGKLPYMPFYVADYLLDTQPLTIGARGIWMDTLCLMWRNEQKGTLEMTVDNWCRTLRCTEAEFLTAVMEFLQNLTCKVLKDESKGTVSLTCRRLQREEKARRKNRLYVQRHRVRTAVRPASLSNQPENQNQSHISESEVIFQKEELREEKKEKKEKSSAPVKPARLASSVGTWEAYATAYRTRYGVDPVRNATTNSQLAALVKRLGETEAPSVAAFYLTHNSAFYVQTRHPTNLLLKDAEGLRTQWATGVKATTLEAKSVEQKDSAREQVQRVRTMLGGA